MALFRYRALSAEGKSLKGVIDADSFNDAKERLRKLQILVTDLSSLQRGGQEMILPQPLLLAFTRELAQLLKAGLPLYESLLTFEEKYRRHRSHPLLLDLCDHLKGGTALSVALKKYPKTFDRVYLSMVQVAEQTGNLAFVFEKLSQLIIRQQKLKKELFSALAYPLFLGAFCFCIVCGLLFFVIPSMRELFEGRALHPMTHCVLAVSQWANDHTYFLSSLVLGLPLGLWFAFQSEKLRSHVQHFLLKIPLLSTLILHASLVRFCRATAMLLQGGVPLLEALQLSQKLIKNLRLEKGVQNAQEKIMQGEKMSAALRAQELFPPLVFRMLAVAEETGKLSDAFQSLAEIYEEELEKHLSQLTAFLQPAMLFILGGIVGLVILSILLPLTDVSSFLNQ